MKRLITLAATFLVLGASSAMAQSGLTMYWDNCSDGGANQKTFACAVNTGSDIFYVSVVIPSSMPSFAASSAIIDMTFEDAGIPAWWQTLGGQCRANAIGMTFDPLNFTTNCGDVWQGSANLSVFQPQQGTNVQGHGANTLRLNSGAAIPAGSEIALTADGSELVVGKVTITHSKTVGTGACAGCTTPVCIVLNECKLQQPAGVGDFTVLNEAAGKTRSLTFNGTPANCPTNTPTQNRTWGAVKSLYR